MFYLTVSVKTKLQEQSDMGPKCALKLMCCNDFLAVC